MLTDKEKFEVVAQTLAPMLGPIISKKYNLIVTEGSVCLVRIADIEAIGGIADRNRLFWTKDENKTMQARLDAEAEKCGNPIKDLAFATFDDDDRAIIWVLQAKDFAPALEDAIHFYIYEEDDGSHHFEIEDNERPFEGVDLRDYIVLNTQPRRHLVRRH